MHITKNIFIIRKFQEKKLYFCPRLVDCVLHIHTVYKFMKESGIFVDMLPVKQWEFAEGILLFLK